MSRSGQKFGSKSARSHPVGDVCCGLLGPICKHLSIVKAVPSVQALSECRRQLGLQVALAGVRRWTEFGFGGFRIVRGELDVTREERGEREIHHQTEII
jgi:hypothetical protein